MSVTEDTTGEGAEEPTTRLAPVDAPAPVTADSLVATAVGDRCNNCGAALAADQRYCVECGHRRGKPRFAVAGTPSPREAAAPRAEKPRKRTGMTSSTTLIAGVATLLLALGVGVLIGHNNSSSKAPATQIVSIPSSAGSGSSTAGTAGSTASGSSAAASTSKSSGSTSKVTAPKKKLAPKAAAAKATQAAAATLKPAAGVKLAPATQTQGGACTAGESGCTNGTFTGNFGGG
jgi:hypothetical protein